MNLYEVILDNGRTKLVLANTVSTASYIAESYYQGAKATSVKTLHADIITEAHR